jgi:hypothetical protein
LSPQRGLCPACDHLIAIKLDGTLRPHGRPSNRCAGTGQRIEPGCPHDKGRFKAGEQFGCSAGLWFCRRKGCGTTWLTETANEPFDAVASAFSRMSLPHILETTRNTTDTMENDMAESLFQFANPVLQAKADAVATALGELNQMIGLDSPSLFAMVWAPNPHARDDA